MNMKKRRIACVMALVMAITLTTAVAVASERETIQLPDGFTGTGSNYILDLNITLVNEANPFFYSGTFISFVPAPGHGIDGRFSEVFLHYGPATAVKEFVSPGLPFTHIHIRFFNEMDGYAAASATTQIPVNFTRAGDDYRAEIKGTLTLKDFYTVVFTDGDGATDGTPTTPPSTQEIKVLVNGSAVTFDQPPIIENGRTLVPLRAIFEALGATVEWEQSTQTVTAVKDDITIILKIGDAFLTKNGERIALDVPAKIVGGRTLVPARAVAESFGADVQWDGTTRTVTITE